MSEAPGGDAKRARDRQLLVESVSGTVEVIALKLAEKVGAEWLDDLISCGNLGAVEAAQTYDFEPSSPAFEGFAWRRIFGAMIDMLRREHVRLPPKLVAALEKAAAAIEAALDYAAELRETGADDVEDEMDGAAVVVAVGLLCLGAGARDPETNLLREESRFRVRQAVAHLAEREQVIIMLRYFEGQKFKAIAEHVGVEPRTIRKRHRAAMKRLAAIFRPMLLPAPDTKTSNKLRAKTLKR
jgi:RNA polymerase sigma factor (sigma-70 family)